MRDLYRRFGAWLWSAPPGSRAAALGKRVVVLGFALLREVAAGQLSLHATSLVYSTMLAIVPLLAFSFSVLQGLGLHRELEPLLMRFFEPLGEQAGELTAHIIRFVDNLSGSGLATVSLAVLVFTSLSMAQRVETSFNFVWRVEQPRSLRRRLSDYLSVLLVGPLAMSVTLGLIAAISSATATARLRGIEPIGDWIAAAGTLTPYVLIATAFSLLYLFVPNTRVRARPALLGGLFAGLLWVGAGNLFTRLIVNASRYEAIYSGFAIVIVAMLWLYISWLILLLGAQLAFYVQYPGAVRRGKRGPQWSCAARERLAFAVMLLVGREFDEPRQGCGIERLAGRIGVGPHDLEPVVRRLARAGLLAETTHHRLMPAKDPRRIDLLEIAAAARGDESDLFGGDDEAESVREVGERIDAALRRALQGETLAQLLDRAAQRSAQAMPSPSAESAARPSPEAGQESVTSEDERGEARVTAPRR